MTINKCPYGVKKDGTCKKKPGPKTRKKTGSRKKYINKCPYGVKKDGTCKTKPGPKTRKKTKTTYMTIKKCKELLREKIKETTKEYK